MEGDLSQSNSAIHASPVPSLLLRGRPLLCLVRGSNPLVPIRFPFVWRHWFIGISRTVFPRTRLQVNSLFCLDLACELLQIGNMVSDVR